MIINLNGGQMQLVHQLGIPKFQILTYEVYRFGPVWFGSIRTCKPEKPTHQETNKDQHRKLVEIRLTCASSILKSNFNCWKPVSFCGWTASDFDSCHGGWWHLTESICPAQRKTTQHDATQPSTWHTTVPDTQNTHQRTNNSTQHDAHTNTWHNITQRNTM